MKHASEAIGLAVTCLYGLFIFHYLFPAAYVRLLAWAAGAWARAKTLFEQIPSTDHLNRMWDVGGTE